MPGSSDEPQRAAPRAESDAAPAAVAPPLGDAPAPSATPQAPPPPLAAGHEDARDTSMLAPGACPAPIQQRDVVVLGHGSGGRLSHALVSEVIFPALDNPTLAAREDQAVLRFDGAATGGQLAFTTDSYVVSPLEFAGGDIGSLAVHGSINDLAVGGARPQALSLALIAEEGLPLAVLQRILASVRRAADAAGVPVVTGDTKVVGRGHGDGLFINTSAVGWVPQGRRLGMHHLKPGDAVVLSGSIGEHGIAIMAAREGLQLEGGLQSDTAPLHEVAARVLETCPETRAMRDPTRGGLAATLVEAASTSGWGIEIDEERVPLRDTVRGACELLGLDPFLVANEGKLVAFVPPAASAAVVQALRQHPLARDAAVIGAVSEQHPGAVVANTPIGGQRIVDLPLNEPLPRIC